MSAKERTFTAKELDAAKAAYSLQRDVGCWENLPKAYHEVWVDHATYIARKLNPPHTINVRIVDQPQMLELVEALSAWVEEVGPIQDELSEGELALLEACHNMFSETEDTDVR